MGILGFCIHFGDGIIFQSVRLIMFCYSGNEFILGWLVFDACINPPVLISLFCPWVDFNLGLLNSPRADFTLFTRS